jgi:ubiquitin carboxyl-terminal hydrolase 7
MYISEDILDNDDKYFAEGYGKQKAKKGIKFLKCPNILILQLKRFEYNQKKEAMVKINEYFEFYEELNLEKYMYKTNQLQDSNENLYSLHSVVVHKGSPNSGHYYAYIKPTIKDDWIQFNDEIVKPADKYEVFDNNFGGTNKYYKLKPKSEISEINYSFESNAYILVYVKKSMRKNILDPLKKENVII